MVHPIKFARFGNVKSWYDNEAICRMIKKGRSLYQPEALHNIECDIANQMPFIKKIQTEKIDFNRPFPEESIVRYEKFMTLVKIYDGVHKLIPPLDVDFVWHGHMLNHEKYVCATKDYFGRILDHDDNPTSKATQEKREEITKALWEKHYGKLPYKTTSDGSNTNSSNSDGFPFFWLWLQNQMISSNITGSGHTGANNGAVDDQDNNSSALSTSSCSSSGSSCSSSGASSSSSGSSCSSSGSSCGSSCGSD